MCFVNERLSKNMVGSDKGRHPSTHGLYTYTYTHTHTFFKHSQRDHTQKTTEAAQGQSRELVPCSMEKFYSTLGLPVDAFQGWCHTVINLQHSLIVDIGQRVLLQGFICRCSSQQGFDAEGNQGQRSRTGCKNVTCLLDQQGPPTVYRFRQGQMLQSAWV